MTKIHSTRVAQDTVALITIDDGKVNTLSKEAIDDLRAAIEAAAAEPGIVAAVIAGREGVFSAGFDLNVLQSGDVSAMTNLVSDGGELISHLFSCDLPIVAACTGHALAAGAFLLLGCDIRVGATGDFKLGMNEVAIGMVLPGWAMTISRERVSPRHLQRAVANARITDATEAVDIGYLDIVVEPDQVIDRAIAEAAALSALDREAYAGTMKQFRGSVAQTMLAQAAADRELVT